MSELKSDNDRLMQRLMSETCQREQLLEKQLSELESDKEYLKTQLELTQGKLYQSECEKIMLLDDRRIVKQTAELYTRHVMEGVLKPKTVSLVDDCIFSHSFSYPDPLLAEQRIQAILSDAYLSRPTSNDVVGTGNFSLVYRCRFTSGYAFSLKRCRKDPLQKCCQEARILSLLGDHANVVGVHGITFINEICHLALTYVGDLTMSSFLSRSSKLSSGSFYSILEGMESAISSIHNRGVLHNHIATSNFILQPCGSLYSPVLIGCGLACRESQSKRLTKTQQEAFKEYLHLTPEVKSGLCKPSFASDIYSFGMVLGCFLEKDLSLDSTGQNLVKCLRSRCIASHTSRLPHWEFRNTVQPILPHKVG